MKVNRHCEKVEEPRSLSAEFIEALSKDGYFHTRLSFEMAFPSSLAHRVLDCVDLSMTTRDDGSMSRVNVSNN